MRLTITSAQLADIEEQARRALPNEASGLIVGQLNSGDATVTALHASEGGNASTKNTKDSFEIDPALHIALQRGLRGQADEIIGVYHSHPVGRAEPSERDSRDAAYPGWVWLITAFEDDAPSTRAFLHSPDGGAFEPVELEVGA